MENSNSENRIQMLCKVEIVGIVFKVAEQVYNDKIIRRMTVVTTFCGQDLNGSPMMENTWIPVVDIRDKGADFDTIEKDDRVNIVGRMRNVFDKQESRTNWNIDVLANSIRKISCELNVEMDPKIQIR